MNRTLINVCYLFSPFIQANNICHRHSLLFKHLYSPRNHFSYNISQNQQSIVKKLLTYFLHNIREDADESTLVCPSMAFILNFHSPAGECSSLF